MESIRRRIVETVELKGTATAGELARTLDVTSADIRHHLRNLARDGVLHPIGTRVPQGRGRPSQVYRVAAREDNLALLAGNLLEMVGESRENKDRAANEIMNETGKKENERINDNEGEADTFGPPFLAGLAMRMGGDYPPPKGHISQRLFRAIQRLNDLRYQAHWEAHPTSPQLTFGACPYAAIIEDHPELCHMDAHLIHFLVGENAEQIAKLEVNLQGLPVCKFAIGG